MYKCIQNYTIYTHFKRLYKIIQFIQTLHICTNVYKFIQMCSFQLTCSYTWLWCIMIEMVLEDVKIIARIVFHTKHLERKGKFLWDILIIEGRQKWRGEIVKEFRSSVRALSRVAVLRVFVVKSLRKQDPFLTRGHVTCIKGIPKHETSWKDNIRSPNYLLAFTRNHRSLLIKSFFSLYVIV